MVLTHALPGVDLAHVAVIVHTDVTESVAGSHGLTHAYQYIIMTCYVLNAHESDRIVHNLFMSEM